MKKIITTAIITGLMSMVAIPAMAAPHHGHEQHRSQEHGKKHDRKKHHVQKPQKHTKQDHKYRAYNQKSIQSHHNWRRGQVLSHSYRGKPYWANYSQQRHLPKAGKNQRWIKVDQDYILINTLSHVIVNILSGR